MDKRKGLHIHPSPFQLVVHLSRLLDDIMNQSWCSHGVLHGIYILKTQCTIDISINILENYLDICRHTYLYFGF